MNKTEKQESLYNWFEKTIIEELEATESKHYKYKIETLYGMLYVSFYKNDLEKGKEPTLSVFCKFENPEFADTTFNCGRTGKWNHFHCDKSELKYIINKIADNRDL